MSGERTLSFMSHVDDAYNTSAGKAYIGDVVSRAKHDLAGDGKYEKLSADHQRIAMALTMARQVLRDLANPHPSGLLTAYNGAAPDAARTFFQCSVDLVVDANRLHQVKAH
ncbi:MAG TPA: hypothetical protein VGO93_20400 [Candidatus Xenobia bacterium]|jgi:hypothetical protein